MRLWAALFLLLVATSVAMLLWPRDSKGPQPDFRRRGLLADTTWRTTEDVSKEHIVGRVHSRGEPVAGAVLRLYPDVNLRLPAVARTTSAADGSFELDQPPSADWTLAVDASGYEPVYVGAHRVPLVIELRCRYPVRGHVRDASGAAVAGAKVVGRILTDAGGAYQLCLTPWQSLWVDAPGFVAPHARPGPRDRVVDFVLRRSPVVTGRVLEHDSDLPVAGMTVRAGHCGAGRSADDGSFRILGCEGRGDIVAYGETHRADPVNRNLRGDETVDVTLRAHRLVQLSIRGVVVDDSGPLHRPMVCIAGECATGDSDGRFVIHTAATRGEHPVTVVGRDGVTPARVNVDPDGPELLLKAGPPLPPAPERPPSVVRGRVTRLGVPVVGAEIAVVGGQSNWAVSGDDGTFLLYEAGRVEAFSRELLAASRIVEVTAVPGQTMEVTLELEHASAIGGVVIDEDGAPVQEAQVRVACAATGDAAVVRARRDGSFYVGALAPGVYVPQVYRGDIDVRPAPLVAGDPIRVPTSDSIVSDVRLVVDTRTATLRGRVVDASGAAVAGAIIVEGPAGAHLGCDDWNAERYPRSGPDGRFSIAELPRGARVSVTAIACDGRRAELRDVAVGRDELVLTVK